jgi:hypothetical protein
MNAFEIAVRAAVYVVADDDLLAGLCELGDRGRRAYSYPSRGRPTPSCAYVDVW